MKLLTILAYSLAAPLACVTIANDAQPNNGGAPSPAQPAAHAGSGASTSTTNAGSAQPPAHAGSRANTSASNPGSARSGMRGATNLGRTSPSLAQSPRRPPLAGNQQSAFRDHSPRQTLAYSERRKVAKNTDGGMVQRPPSNNHLNYSDAARRHRLERHDCNWWRKHFTVIVFVSTGYYFWDAGYWYPAWGYDPAYDYYEYNGPIYTYGNLLPDQVVANVQRALQEEGYYAGAINGSLGPATRAALANYQRDQGLIVTGAIDQPTVESLGLE